MPKLIPSEHLLANKACKAVQSLFARCNILSEDIKNDYGKDIMLQTELKNQADSFSIFVQVKGKNLKFNDKGESAIRARVVDMKRWASFANPVMLCVYDEISKNIYSIDVRYYCSLWFLSTTNNKTITLRISKENILDENNIEGIIWKYRIDHYSRSIAWQESSEFYAERDGHSDDVMHEIRLEKNLIFFHFLNAIGFLGKDKFSASLLNQIRNCSKNFARKNKLEQKEHKLGLPEVFVLVVLARSDKIGAGGLPRILLDGGSMVLHEFYKRSHPKHHSLSKKIIDDEINNETC